MKMMRLLFCLIGIIFVVSVLPEWSTASSTGKDFFELADNYKNFADFEKASQYCDKSISIFLATPNKDEETLRDLSKAYYLKSNLLCYMQEDDDKIETELFNAIMVSPDYIPPKNYTNHPVIEHLLENAKGKYQDYVNATFDKAMGFFSNDEYCLAKEMLEPIANRYKKNPGRIGEMLEKCNKLCADQLSASAEANPVENEEKMTFEPISPKSMADEIGIFPIQYTGDFSQDEIETFNEYFNQNKIKLDLKRFREIKPSVIIPTEHTDYLKRAIKLSHLSDLMIEPIETSSLEAAIENIIKEIVGSKSEKLSSDLREKLLKLFQSEKLTYLLFVEIKKNSSSEKRFVLSYNMYHFKKLSYPVSSGVWSRYSKINFVKLFRELGESINELFDTRAHLQQR